jgi:hypothetical protein
MIIVQIVKIISHLRNLESCRYVETLSNSQSNLFFPRPIYVTRLAILSVA